MRNRGIIAVTASGSAWLVALLAVTCFDVRGRAQTKPGYVQEEDYGYAKGYLTDAQREGRDTWYFWTGGNDAASPRSARSHNRDAAQRRIRINTASGWMTANNLRCPESPGPLPASSGFGDFRTRTSIPRSGTPTSTARTPARCSLRI